MQTACHYHFVILSTILTVVLLKNRFVNFWYNILIMSIFSESTISEKHLEFTLTPKTEHPILL
jgi:hypothetical protein